MKRSHHTHTLTHTRTHTHTHNTHTQIDSHTQPHMPHTHTHTHTHTTRQLTAYKMHYLHITIQLIYLLNLCSGDVWVGISLLKLCSGLVQLLTALVIPLLSLQPHMMTQLHVRVKGQRSLLPYVHISTYCSYVHELHMFIHIRSPAPTHCMQYTPSQAPPAGPSSSSIPRYRPPLSAKEHKRE